MTLSAPQRDYLELLTERPSNRPTTPREWWNKLWLANCFDVIGNSVYITETGRKALEEMEIKL